MALIDKPKNYQTWRSNAYRQNREMWCVERFCQLVGLEHVNITPEAEQRNSIDIWVDNQGKKSKIQVTEIAPHNPSIMEKFEWQAAGMPFSSLIEEVSEMVNNEIKNKEANHYADANELNLLIYLNGPHEIIFDPELDIDLPSLQSANQNSTFPVIILLMDEEVFYLKGDSLVTN